MCHRPATFPIVFVCALAVPCVRVRKVIHDFGARAKLSVGCHPSQLHRVKKGGSSIKIFISNLVTLLRVCSRSLLEKTVFNNGLGVILLLGIIVRLPFLFTFLQWNHS